MAADWRAEFETNVLTAVLLTSALRPRLRRPGGRVINLSSIAALRGGGDSYSAAKAAVIGWTLSLAGELGADGVTVNVVVPGHVQDTEFFSDTMTEQRRSRLISQTLLGRGGEPEDVAGMARFLASEQAAFVTARSSRSTAAPFSVAEPAGRTSGRVGRWRRLRPARRWRPPASGAAP